MSSKARSIVEQIKSLSSEDQQEVFAEVMRLDSSRREWEEQKTRLHEMQKRHKGRGLLEKLLNDRSQERTRG
jgi:hypothetical protein